MNSSLILVSSILQKLAGKLYTIDKLNTWLQVMLQGCLLLKATTTLLEIYGQLVRHPREKVQ